MTRMTTFAALAIALLVGAACPAAAEAPANEQQSPVDGSAKEMFQALDKAAKTDAPARQANAETAADKEQEDKLKQCIADCEKEKPEDRPMCIEGCNGQDFK